MTQELVIGVLLSGFVGLVWIMAFAILNADHATHETSQDAEVMTPADNERSEHITSQRDTFAA